MEIKPYYPERNEPCDCMCWPLKDKIKSNKVKPKLNISKHSQGQKQILFFHQKWSSLVYYWKGQIEKVCKPQCSSGSILGCFDALSRFHDEDRTAIHLLPLVVRDMVGLIPISRNLWAKSEGSGIHFRETLQTHTDDLESSINKKWCFWTVGGT